ncbi:hypothetical protein PVAP13_3NG246526, partial [Panicum virgatum]
PPVSSPPQRHRRPRISSPPQAAPASRPHGSAATELLLALASTSPLTPAPLSAPASGRHLHGPSAGAGTTVCSHHAQPSAGEMAWWSSDRHRGMSSSSFELALRDPLPICCHLFCFMDDQ